MKLKGMYVKLNIKYLC